MALIKRSIGRNVACYISTLLPFLFPPAGAHTDQGALPQFSADMVLSGGSYAPSVRAKLYVGDGQLRVDVPKRPAYARYNIYYHDGGLATTIMMLKNNEQGDGQANTLRNLVILILGYRPAGKDTYCDGYAGYVEHLPRQTLRDLDVALIKKGLKCEKLGEETSGNDVVEKLKLTLPADFGGVTELKYVPVRRFAMFVQSSVSTEIQNAKFEPPPKKRFDVADMM
jgi:hypothetical protein